MNRLVLLFELLACSFSLLVLSGCPPAPPGPPDCTVTHCTIPDGGYALWACDDERDTLYVDLSAFEVGPSLNPGYEELECDADVVEYWLKRGTQPDISDDENRTPLIYGALAGSLGIVAMLLERGARLDLKDKFGLTALAAAAAEGEISVVAILLEAGAKPNVQNKYGQSPLMLAAKSGWLDVVQLLLDSGADATMLDYTGRGVLGWSDEGRNRSVRRVLEKAGARE